MKQRSDRFTVRIFAEVLRQLWIREGTTGSLWVQGVGPLPAFPHVTSRILCATRSSVDYVWESASSTGVGALAARVEAFGWAAAPPKPTPHGPGPVRARACVPAARRATGAHLRTNMEF